MKKIAAGLIIVLLASLLAPCLAAPAQAPAEELVVCVGQEGYTENGKWETSESVMGYQNQPSRFTSRVASASFTPVLAQGFYRVSVYKSVHPNSAVQKFTIHHQDQADTVVVDFTQGTNGWEEVGTFDFWGNGEEGVITALTQEELPAVYRVSAVKFTLVGASNEPVPSMSPVPSPTPTGQAISKNEIKLPGDAQVMSVDQDGYSQEGVWELSETVKGYQDTPSKFTGRAAWAKFTPVLPHGTYRVSIYKAAHPMSAAEEFEISHQGKTDKVTIDFSQGEAGWVEAGTFDFWGNGTEAVLLTRTAEAEGIYRISNVKFELVRLLDGPVPTVPPTPEPTKNPTITTVPAYQYQYQGIGVVLDGELQQYDQPPILIQDRTMVPLRGIFEGLGAKVKWNEEEQRVTATCGGRQIGLKIGELSAEVDGEAVALDVASQVVNDRTLVPIRFVSEALGAQVDWREEQNLVWITSGKPVSQSIFVQPRDFTELGTWQFDKDIVNGAMNGISLKGMTSEEPGSATEEALPAKAVIPITEAGEYRLYVHTRDYTTALPGARHFEIELNGQRISHTFGQHGTHGWVWEEIGPVTLQEGALEITLVDTSRFYARCDGIFLTKDPAVKAPPAGYDQLVAVGGSHADGYVPDVYYPEEAKVQSAPISETEIGNELVRLRFFTVPTDEGTVIQREMRVKSGDTFTLTTGRENQMGDLLLYAYEASLEDYAGQFPVFKSTFDQKGSRKTVIDSDIYKVGKPYWMIPDRVVQIDEHTVELYASCDVAEGLMRITLPEGAAEPRVTYTLTPKTDGQFCMNYMAGAENSLEETNMVLAPLRFSGNFLPEESCVVTEQYLTLPLSLKTLNGKTTTGIVLEPSLALKQWPYRDENIRLGVGLRSPEGKVQNSLIAPLFGTPEANRKAGQTYQIQYRIVEEPQDWYETYCRIAKDIFGFTDYRKNYYATLNEAIFNTVELAKSEKGGWDEDMWGYYNIEGNNIVTQSNPLIFLSHYLISDDQELMDTRGVQSLATMLTRKGFHYANQKQGPSMITQGYLDNGGKDVLGTPTRAYGNTTFGGAAALMGALSPAYTQIGVGSGLRNNDEYGSVPKFSEYTWLYRFTGNAEALAAAKKEADLFISHMQEGTQRMKTDLDFVAVSYYPMFMGLIDLYEACGEKKYLDAAHEGAKWLIPTVFAYPNLPEEELTVSADSIGQHHIVPKAFYGSTPYTVGYPEGMDALKDETVPFWVVSRAGLSIEGVGTYTNNKTANMIMANWAPDLMRLYAYTGDEMLQTVARSAVIGRHSNYPGYYLNQYSTLQMKPEYPYEGPDITGIYWHHIQPFLAMLEDFLFTQAFAWSGRQIDFPSVRCNGYAYFNNRQYGLGGGRFFEEENMAPWLKEGLVSTDQVQIDWIGTRKDAAAGFAFMNEDQQELTVQIQLSEEAAGGIYTGAATLYDARGNRSQVQVAENRLELTIPGRSLAAIVIHNKGIQGSAMDRISGIQLEQGIGTAAPAEGEADHGAVIQVSPDYYYAYVYTTDAQETLDKVTLHYRIGTGGWQELTREVFGFEFLVKVPDPSAAFTFYVERETKDGTILKSSEKKLSPRTK